MRSEFGAEMETEQGKKSFEYETSSTARYEHTAD